MSSPATINKHPIHPILVTVPVGLWLFSFIADILYLTNWGSAAWLDVGYYAMLGGLVGALVAAIPGLMDYFTITDAPTKRLGTKHLIINLTLVVLYAANLVTRAGRLEIMTISYVLSFAGVILLVYSGWLGGEMIFRHGMAVHMEGEKETTRESEASRHPHMQAR
jgi:uncharacterized membrane protein